MPILAAIAALALVQQVDPAPVAPPAPPPVSSPPAISAPAPANLPELGDVRCLAVYSYLAGAPDPASDEAKLVNGILYFTGKLYGRNPGYDLPAGLKAALIWLGEAGVKAELPRCSQELDTANARLDAASKALSHTAAPN